MKHTPARLALPGRLVLLTGFVLLGSLALLGSCTTQQGDTILVNGLDCGLVRADMAGTWSVTFLADSATTVNCDSAPQNGALVSVSGATVNYANAIAFPGPSGASFNANATGPNNRPNELMASIEADSCLALVQIWQENAHGWVQCIGTLDRTSRLIASVCDAIDLDTNSDGAADVACDLSHSLQATIGTP
jgi:hypothetical protein